jgi:L,D-peptidoglycan transpeptidase YkuD (ErfK/YbiS/YcfS/YnhG family)
MDIFVSADHRLNWNGRDICCALGRSGILFDKREGDGGTPVGAWSLRRVFYRPDRVAKPDSALNVSALSPADGWCDDPAHPDYNRFITLPHPASCETMWREDGLYDVVVILGHNDDPPVQRHFPARGQAGLRSDRGLRRPGSDRSAGFAVPCDAGGSARSGSARAR